MDLLSLLKNRFPDSGSGSSRIYSLTGSSPALFLALQETPFIAVEKDEETAEVLAGDINFYRNLLSREQVFFLPDPDGPSVSGARAGIIYSLRESGSLITSAKNLNSSLWEKEAIEKSSIRLEKGIIFLRDNLKESLVKLGYKNVPMVVGKGEFSQRGWITDIFSSTSENPVRLEFFGDEIEQIRIFDIDSQRSTEEIESLMLLPSVESEDTRRLFDIFPEKRFFCLYPAKDKEEFPGDVVFLSKYSFEDEESPSAEVATVIPQINAGMSSMKGLGILPEERKSLDDLPENIKRISRNKKVVIIASSEGQTERLRDMFMEKELVLPFVDIKDLPDFIDSMSVTIGRLSAGINSDGLIILTARELFGERTAFRPIVKSRVSNLLFSLDDISAGDFIVHRERGIGRFSGIVRQKVYGNELELIMIEYGDGRLYIPIQNIKDISKYHAEEGAIPKIDCLGGKTWLRKKEKARKKANEIAERLMALYADRKETRGFVFSPDTELHREFDGFFAYEETPDQTKAIEDIKKDMESEKPMDRLLCGDVGYGKTEVAMRAVFKAVYDNRQAAVLVPTTILAEQHYRTFKERFSGFPINIDFISRFKSKKQIDHAIKAISNGEIDIVIGTHSLLSKKIQFNRLGLLIVDEEHRFGVAQKEKVKELTKDIDVLNLTATPIPRTLHMALSGIRDVSIIETPPEERLSVKTVVTAFNDNLIKEALLSELRRNGQVFFVHNRISDIARIALHIKSIVPSAEVAIAHGRMPERELEKIMHRFFEGEIDILVSTAIIGSGLDIPRANTIIINRADKMGLADLYQLRGRVGRSNLKGHAFLVVPGEALMTEEAKKRIQAVQEMSYLGAGFRLAMKDLEIRGAGNIFGPEQSGHINEIGFDLYIEMLEKAVAELKGIEIKEEIEPEIDIKISALIPETYIGDVTLRLSFYRRIASLKTEKDIEVFEAELKDRFGLPPVELLNLLDVIRLKILARELTITKLQESQGKIKVFFSPDTIVQPQHIFSLNDSRKGMIKFLPDGFELDSGGFHGKMVFEDIYGALRELKEKINGMISK